MAIYRTVSLLFWTDSKVVDNFTPKDKYFYLYLLTNPHTNLCGCYEISKRQMAAELGYSVDTIDKLLKRFRDELNLIGLSEETNELIIFNWHKYNWTNSPKFKKPLLVEIQKIKEKSFKEYLSKVFEGNTDTVSIPYPYGSDTTVTVTVTDTVTVSDTDKEKKKDCKEKEEKIHFAEFVSMTNAEYDKLVSTYGEKFTNQCIETLDNYKGSTGKKYKDDYRAILSWVIDKVKEKQAKEPKKRMTDEEEIAMYEKIDKEMEEGKYDYFWV